VTVIFSRIKTSITKRPIRLQQPSKNTADKRVTVLTLFDNNLEGGIFRPRCKKPLACGVYKNPGHTKFWQEAALHLRNMKLPWKKIWNKKTALPSIKKN
jgi:hypothetical protein